VKQAEEFGGLRRCILKERRYSLNLNCMSARRKDLSVQISWSVRWFKDRFDSPHEDTFDTEVIISNGP
jgi:hypothetical protein